jgi:diadenosine tetraphosphate (Ap4A) HIT family hydrolase
METNCDCGLCDELSEGTMPSQLRDRGQRRLNWLDDDWALFASLGPVSPVHLLLAPCAHATFSLQRPGALALIERLTSTLRELEPLGRRFVLFEHANSARGCGVTHAHVHALTVPRSIRTQDLFGPFGGTPMPGLSEIAAERSELFWWTTLDGAPRATVDVSMPSQWARRAAGMANDVAFDTDWKAYTHMAWFESSCRVADEIASMLRAPSCLAPARPAA